MVASHGQCAAMLQRAQPRDDMRAQNAGMLPRPYGILVRQDASGSRKREQAPALRRNVAARKLGERR